MRTEGAVLFSVNNAFTEVLRYSLKERNDIFPYRFAFRVTFKQVQTPISQIKVQPVRQPLRAFPIYGEKNAGGKILSRYCRVIALVLDRTQHRGMRRGTPGRRLPLSKPESTRLHLNRRVLLRYDFRPCIVITFPLFNPRQ